MIADGPLAPGLDVSPDWLRSVAKLPHQFRTLDESLKQPTADAMVFTFDDGDPTVGTHAVPVLAEFGIRASAFVMAPVERRAPAFWSELLAAGWEIGSHSISHPALDLLGAPQARLEVRESKLRLEDMLGIPVRGFAFPYGRFGRREIDFVVEAGYEYAVTTLPWIPARWRSCGVRMVPRKMCEERTSLQRIQLLAANRAARVAAWMRDEFTYRMRGFVGTASSPLRVLPPGFTSSRF